MEEKIRKSRERLSFVRGFLTAFAVLAVIYFGSLALPIGGNAKKPGTLQALRKSKEIERVVQNHFLGEIDEQAQTDMMFVGQIAGLGDEYSTYYTAEQYQKVREKQSGSFMGIGISVAREEDNLVIVDVVDGYPAAKAGILPEDIILKINGESTEGFSTTDCVTAIQNSKNGVVMLKIKRESFGEPLDFEIEMAPIESTSVTGSMMEDSIGYIQISHFTGVTSNQFKNTYGELKIQGMKKLIIDLRGNPGGLVDSVCDTLSQILPEGVIVYTEDRNGNRSERVCDGLNKIDIPLVVLINGESASSAEIFAGAVKDYEIGTLVGETTFGKGIVQDAYRLSDGSYLKLTVSKYYTPDGNDIHKVGITPDVEVKMTKTDKSDIQLEKAIKVISKMK